MSPQEKTLRQKAAEKRLLAKLARGPVATFAFTTPERGRLRALEIGGKVQAKRLTGGVYSWELVPEKE